MKKLHLNNAKFLKSVADLKQLPEGDCLEVAFVGRSNAGKSSALNSITKNGKLARTSKTPGRTQLINFFEVSTDRYLVDLPGYGFAKVDRKTKKDWGKLLSDYINTRKELCGIVIIMDIRHPLTDFDNGMLKLANYYGIPVHILLTKADKLKRGSASNTLLTVKKEVAKWDINVSVQLFSALKKTGVEEAEKTIIEFLQNESAN